MIDRYQLRYFLAVVETGNSSRAAAKMNVSQPTLSVGIAKLDKGLGATLFLGCKALILSAISGLCLTIPPKP